MTTLNRLIYIVFFSLFFCNVIAQTNQTVVNGEATAPVIFPQGCTYRWTCDRLSIGLASSGTGNIPSFTAVNNSASAVNATIIATPVTADYAYIPNAGSNNVSVINLSTNRVEKTIAVGNTPNTACVNPSGSEVYICNAEANSISVISTISNTVVANIAVGRTPIGIVFSQDGSRAYVTNVNAYNISNANTVSVINTLTRMVIATIPTDENPREVIISPDGKFLYVSMGYYNGLVQVYDTSTNRFVKEYETRGDAPGQMIFSRDNKKLYVVNSYSNSLTILSLTGDPSVYIPLGRLPIGAVMGADGKHLYVTNTSDNNIMILDLTTNAVVGLIPTGLSPCGISITPDGQKLLVGSAIDKVSVFDTGTNLLVTNITAGSQPYAMGNPIKAGSNAGCSPKTFTITVNPSGPVINSNGTPGAQNTIYGEASASSSFTISGSGLTQGITISAPAGFEISLNNLSFSQTLTINGTGNIAPKIVYVRLSASSPAGSYSGNITLSSTGATSINVPITVSQIVPAPLNITTANQIKTYGSVLTGNTGYTAFTATGLKNGERIGSVTIAYGNGAAAVAAVASYNNQIGLSGATGGTFSPANYQVSYQTADITVARAPLTITAQTLTKLYGTILTDGPLASGFTVTGLKNGEMISNVSLIYGSGAAQGAAVGIYAGAVVPAAPSGNFSTDNYDISFVAGELNITPRPLTVTALPQGKNPGESDPLLSYQLTSGSLLASDQFTGQLLRDTGEAPGDYTIRQGDLSAGINYNIVYHPALFRIAKAVLTISAESDQRTYGENNPVFKIHYSGFINGDDQSVFTAMPVATSTATKLSDAGLYPIDVNGASARNYVVNYVPGVLTIAKAPLTITADNQQKITGGQNPPLTVNYSGFVNGDNPGQLIRPPQVTTTVTVQSASGQYPIDIGGADAVNYVISYIPGLFTVIPVSEATIVTNSFSPNGDGINDQWTLNFLQNYPQCRVQVFSRSGAIVFSSIGYQSPWDGTYKGSDLPLGTYYYMIELKNSKRILSGSITILR
ncbi:MBG domain-containing protein [Pedobacter sp. PF22-3]|uniref:MBG domain-containing protein n=1 Tax=Pedobacter sp. PF22-3 TaxID=2994467 RepID=UPI00224793CA|nr:MBG domain-containing protein [Pedobacter sp. PF22-3]MCX2494449.1 MBG domain-containing protein [Pedobacter sp. PF22-3]